MQVIVSIYVVPRVRCMRFPSIFCHFYGSLLKSCASGPHATDDGLHDTCRVGCVANRLV